MTINDYNLYFFNDQYDDLLVSNFLFNLNHKLYNTAIRQQKILQNSNMYFGTMSEFHVSKDVNNKYGLTTGSYSAEIPLQLVPSNKEKAFIKKYGYEKIIPLTTIIKDSTVFMKSPILNIGNYTVMIASIIILQHSIIIAIAPNSTDGLSVSTMSNFISSNAQWSMSLNPKSDYYYCYKARDLILSTVNIALTNFTTKVLYNKGDKLNNYDVYMSALSAEPNLLIHSTGTMTTVNSTQYFQVSTAFRDYVYNNVSAIKTFVLNNYRKNGYGKFVYSGSNSPIIKIPFNVNPVDVDNITVWTYDSTNDILQRHVQNNITSHYPNVYDLRNMWDGSSNLYIEWSEFSTLNTVFDNNFKDYIKCYDDTYASMIINKTAPAEILNYTPISDFEYSYADYLTSEYKGDIRAYKLSKLYELLHDNPLRYKLFMDYVYTNIQKKSTFSMTSTTHPLVFSRSVMSNTAECDGDTTLLQTFTVAHTYIKLYNPDNKKRSVYVYVDGIRIPVTLIFNIGYDTYVYFPKSYITSTSKILVDVSKISDLDSQVVAQIYLSATDTQYEIVNGEELGNISYADTMFYYANGKQYIDNSNFTYTANFRLYYITHESWREEYIIDKQLLMTSLAEYFSPIDADYFVLTNNVVSLDAPASKFYRKVSADGLKFRTNNVLLLKRRINFTRSDIYMSAFVSDIKSTNTIALSNFKGKPDSSRFRVFVGGILLNTSQYTISVPTYYGGTVNVTVTGYPTTSRTDGVLEYLPMDEDVIYDGTPDSTIYNNGLVYLDTLSTKPIDLRLCRIYIDGKRVHNSDIVAVGLNDAYKITGYTGTRLTVYQQSMDNDAYDYSTAKTKMNLNVVAKADSTFATYLKNN